MNYLHYQHSRLVQVGNVLHEEREIYPRAVWGRSINEAIFLTAAPPECAHQQTETNKCQLHRRRSIASQENTVVWSKLGTYCMKKEKYIQEQCGVDLLTRLFFSPQPHQSVHTNRQRGTSVSGIADDLCGNCLGATPSQGEWLTESLLAHPRTHDYACRKHVYREAETTLTQAKKERGDWISV